MHDASRIAQLLLESADRLAQASEAKAIIVAADALTEVEALPSNTILVSRARDDKARLEALRPMAHATIEVPPAELDRLGQVKLSAIIAISNRLLGLHDSAIFLTGPYRSLVDTMVVMSIGAEYELFDSTEQPDIEEHIKRAVFHRVLSIALELGQHGREGRNVGALFVVGDHERVLEQTEQMILNPFKGYPQKDRNILNDAMRETVREFSTLDGAFIIRGSGVIETAGAHIKAAMSTGLPSGLGARHAAAAGITANSKSIGFTVSETDGTVRVWRAGKMVASFGPSRM